MAESQHKFVTTNGIYPSFSNGLQPLLLQSCFLKDSTRGIAKLSRKVILTMETSVQEQADAGIEVVNKLTAAWSGNR